MIYRKICIISPEGRHEYAILGPLLLVICALEPEICYNGLLFVVRSMLILSKRLLFGIGSRAGRGF